MRRNREVAGEKENEWSDEGEGKKKNKDEEQTKKFSVFVFMVVTQYGLLRRYQRFHLFVY
jgi:hypothetical protein